MKVGVVGYGYWGPNLVRNLVDMVGLENVAVCDLAQAGRNRAGRDYPGIRTEGEVGELLADASVGAVAIATPAATHRDLVERSLRAGKHVLVEKPLGTSSAEAAALLDLAGRTGRVLMADFTFVFNPAVEALKSLLDDGRLGRVAAILSTRMNMGLHRPDVDVIWDLYVHDLSIFQYWLGGPPETVTAVGRDCVGTGKTDIAFLAARYPNGTIAQVSAAWLAPRKAREMIVIGSRAMAVYDDTAAEKLLLYDSHADLIDGRVIYTTAATAVPVPVAGTEALARMIGHFLDCVREGRPPATGAAFSLAVLRTLEAATRALAAPGSRVSLTGWEA
ncbi:MAG TPA: Gfo/Idh/MocA family oxidoreductase [Symbiobacteriaceae bacterium]|nr:Gfo/Idh/MocA family oxidoreductase [Symbiobacteriaceae bacterium]